MGGGWAHCLGAASDCRRFKPQFLHQNCPGFESSLRLSLQPSPPSPPGQWGVTVSVLQAGSEGSSSPEPGRSLCPLSNKTHWDNGVLQWSWAGLGPNTGAVTPCEGSEMKQMDLKQKGHDEGLLMHQLSALPGPDTPPRTLTVERAQPLPLAPQGTAVVCVVPLSPHAQMARGPSSTILGETPSQPIPL